MNNQKTNWKYLLIVVMLAFVVSGGILGYQYWWLPKQEIEGQTMKFPEQKFAEVLMNELKEGKNGKNNVIIEKINPELLYDAVNEGPRREGVEARIIDYYEYEEGKRAPCYYRGIKLTCYEFTYLIEDKVKIKMIGKSVAPGEESYDIYNFSIIDEKGRIIDKRESFVIEKIDEPLYGSTYLQLKTFNFVDKIYFLIQGNAIIKHEFKNLFFLYVVDQEGKVKFITSGAGNIDYGLRIEKNFYLKVGELLWEFDENDVLRNKFPANKIIIKDNEVLFR